MRAITLTLLVLLTACIAAWWAFAGDPALPPPNHADQQTTIAAAASLESIETATGAVEASADRERTTTSSELEESKAPPIPEKAQWLDVQIVDRASGEPVADADVYWCNQLQWELLGTLPMAEQVAMRDTDRRARKYGWRTRSDANGLVRVTLQANQVEVIAEKHGLYGRATLQGEPLPRDGHRVELEPDIVLRVKVLEQSGKPAPDVSVGVTDHDPANGVDRTVWWWVQGNVETDAEGIATFAHMQRRQRQKQDHVEKTIPQWLVHVRSPGLTVEPVAVDAQAPPTEPVVISLPASGHLRVQVLSGGKPYCDEQVWLYVKPENENDGSGNYMAMAKEVPRTLDKQGWVDFRHVALGKQFQVGSWIWSAPVLGPVSAAEVCSVTVNLDEHAVVLAGRVLHRDGRPLVRESCTLSLDADNEERQRTMQATQADGSFVMLLAPGNDGAPLDRMALMVKWDPKDGEGQFAEFAPRAFPIGRTDLGEVRLQAASVIVSGRIVPNCEAMGRCFVQIEQMVEAAASSTPQWRGMHDVNVPVAEDLSFAAYGTVPAGRYRLRVHGEDFVAGDPVEFVVGARDLQLEVTCGNKLRVHCLLPEPLTGTHVRMNLVPTIPSPRRWNAQHRSRGAGEADYHWNGLPAGSYTLEVQPEGSGRSTPLHRVEGIELPLAGEADGMLPDIDLRGLLSALQLDVTLAEEKNGNVLVFAMPQQTEVWQGMQVRAGKSILPMVQGETELLIAAEGYEPVTLQGVSGSASANLQRRPRVQIKVIGLEGLPAVCRARVRAEPVLAQPKDGRRYRAGWQRGRLGSLLQATDLSSRVNTGVAELMLADGSYHLSISIEHRKTSRSEKLKQLSPNEIDSSGSYQLQVSPEEVARLVAELAKPAEQQPANK